MIMQDAQVEFASARRRRAACRDTLTDDNAAMADLDKQYAQVICRRFLSLRQHVQVDAGHVGKDLEDV